MCTSPGAPSLLGTTRSCMRPAAGLPGAHRRSQPRHTSTLALGPRACAWLHFCRAAPGAWCVVMAALAKSPTRASPKHVSAAYPTVNTVHAGSDLLLILSPTQPKAAAHI